MHDLSWIECIEAKAEVTSRFVVVTDLRIDGRNARAISTIVAILDGRPVTSKHPREVLEVRNAANAYDRASKFKIRRAKKTQSKCHSLSEILSLSNATACSLRL